MQTHDSRGQAFPNHLVLNDDSHTVTETDIYATLEPANIHGPLYTSYFKEFAAFYRSKPSYTKDRLLWLTSSTNILYRGERGGPVIGRPPQQFPKDKFPSRRMMLVHGLTPRGESILRQAGRHHAIKHGAWFDHQVANACISGSLHLSALHAEQRFITPDEITDDLGVKVPFEIVVKGVLRTYESIRLVPDYLFGIDRYYAVETDLGNEVCRAEEPHKRKTYERMVLQYLELIGGKLYHAAYNIPSNKALMVLFVTTDAAKTKLMESIIEQYVGHCNFILMKHIPAEAFSAYHSPKPLWTLWTEPWKRAGRSDFYINNPARQ